MRHLVLCLYIFMLIAVMAATKATGQQQSETSSINWHPFEWYTGNNYFENTPDKIILGNFRVGGIPDAMAFELSLNSPFSVLHERAYDVMIYRNPTIGTHTDVVQRASNFRERVLRNMDISINRQLLGDEVFRIEPPAHEENNGRLSGMIGFGIFHRNQKVLIVDNASGRFASVDELPAEFEEKAHFIPMKVIAGYLVIPVMIDGRPVEMFFDGTSRPAMVFFHNRTFRQMASSQPAAEKLRHLTNNTTGWLDGFQPSATAQFGDLPLASHNVYFSKEKAPSSVRGVISRAFFDEYIMIFDYKNSRFGIIQSDLIAK
jgi:hypothetical protein